MPRIAWYALGGGLGHLQRALAVLRHLRPLVPDAGVLLLTSAAYPHLAMDAGVPVVRVPGAAEAALFPKGAVGALTATILARIAPVDLLVVDTFAAGLHLELTPEVLGLAHKKALIWRAGGPEPGGAAYDLILAPEPVAPRPDVEAVGWVLARRADEGLTPTDARRWLGLAPAADRPLILGMHAGEPGEVATFFDQLRAAAAQLGRPHDLRLITPLPLAGQPTPGLVHHHPAAELLPAVDLLVSGGGYNSVNEARAFGIRAVRRPFGRSHDDQAARAAGEPTYGPLDDAADVAELLAAALDAPPPLPTDPALTDGARATAMRLAALLRG